jgi:hypothetical protein
MMAYGKSDKPEDIKAVGEKWMAKIRASQEREKAWRDDASAAEKAYAVDDKAQGGKLYDFNILHSNVETIVPSLYNSTPTPDIRRRFNDKEPIARKFAEILERTISLQIDDNRLDTEVEASVQDAFLAGRGIVRLRFVADEQDEPAIIEEIETEETPDEPQDPRLVNERVQIEAVSWRDFAIGKAQRWRDVPWVAFKHRLDRAEADDLIDHELYNQQFAEDDGKPFIGEEGDEIDIWEVWCKRSKTVKFIRAEDAKLIKMVEDPLGLSGFFPMPAPVQPIQITGKMTPVCPFVIYKRLADELDRLTKRINKIAEGMKVRGIMAGSADDVDNLSKAGDNEIVVSANLEQLAATKGLDGMISWWPIETSAKVLRELYAQREQVKQSIYEITGISDIVRGASEASETATAQQIKTQWGSLRIKKLQNLIQRQVRDIFVVMAEIITTKFSPERIEQMTGVSLMPSPQDDEAALNEKMALFQLMQQPVLSAYRVDIETDSTIRADVAKAKGEMGEFLQGTASYFQTMGPLLAQAPQAAEPVVEIYGAFAQYFNLGKQAEDALERLVDMAKEAGKQPQEQGPSPEQMAAEAEMQAKQADMQAKQQAFEIDMQRKAVEHDAKMQAFITEQQAKAKEREDAYAMRLAEHDMRMQEMQADRVFKQQERQTQAEQLRMKGDYEKQRHEQSISATKHSADLKRAEAGLPALAFDEERDVIKQIVQKMQGADTAIAQMIETVSESQAQIGMALQGVAMAIKAPKRVVRDSQGNPVGVETVMN